MYLIDRQYEFVLRQLRESASSVGIEIEKSGDALVVLALFAEGGEESLSDLTGDEVTEAEAKRLLSISRTKTWYRILEALGNACFMKSRNGWITRSWETDDCWPFGEEFKSSELKYRVLCDFAMHTGIAAQMCSKYLSGENHALPGARARAKKYDDRRDKVIERMKAIDNHEAMSADALADELIGIVELSHRKIADHIRTWRNGQKFTPCDAPHT